MNTKQASLSCLRGDNSIDDSSLFNKCVLLYVQHIVAIVDHALKMALKIVYLQR